MSFGFSIGDFIILTQLASRVVNGAREACGVHDEFTREVFSLHIVLNALQREVAKPQSILNSSDDDRKKELAALVQPCQSVLGFMEKILDKYNGMADEKKRGTRLRKKIHFGGKIHDLDKIRHNLATHKITITMFLNLQSVGSLSKLEVHMNGHKGDMQGLQESVNWIVGSLQARGGPGEGSILTSYGSDDKSFWKDLRRELVKEGYSSQKLEKHKTTIHEYVRALGEQGAFDDLPPIEETTAHMAENKITTTLKIAAVSEISRNGNDESPIDESRLQQPEPTDIGDSIGTAEQSSLDQTEALLSQGRPSIADHSLDGVSLKQASPINQKSPKMDSVRKCPSTVKPATRCKQQHHFYHTRWCRTSLGKSELSKRSTNRHLNPHMHGRGDCPLQICPELRKELSYKSHTTVTNSTDRVKASALPGSNLKRSGGYNDLFWPHERISIYVQGSQSGEGVLPLVLKITKACSVTSSYFSIPCSHNIRRWNPDFRFLVVRTDVFDHYHFGRWVYDWNAKIHGVLSHTTMEWVQIWSILSQIASCVHFWDRKLAKVGRLEFVPRLIHKWFHYAFSLLEQFNQLVQKSEEATVQSRSTESWGIDEVQYFVAHLTAARLPDDLLMPNWYARARAWSLDFGSLWDEVNETNSKPGAK